MVEIIRGLQREVYSRLMSHAFVADARGSLSIDGITLSGIDGGRTIDMFLTDVSMTVKDYGFTSTKEFYRRRHQIPVAYGKNLHTSMNLMREVDAATIAGRI